MKSLALKDMNLYIFRIWWWWWPLQNFFKKKSRYWALYLLIVIIYSGFCVYIAVEMSNICLSHLNMFLYLCFSVRGRRSASGNSIQYNNIELVSNVLTAQKKVYDIGINSRSGLEIYMSRMISSGQRGRTKLAQTLWNIVFEWNVSSNAVKHWHLQDEAHFYPSDCSSTSLLHVITFFFLSYFLFFIVIFLYNYYFHFAI